MPTRRCTAAICAGSSATSHGDPASAAILLNARGTKPGEAVAVDGALPAQIFLHREGIAVASLLKAEKATANRGDHFSLAAYHPAPSAGGREISNGEGTAIGPDDVTHSRMQLT